MRCAAGSVDAFHRAARAQRVERAVTAAVGTEQQRVADRFLALAGDALEALAVRPPEPGERADLVALEGRLRDEITAGPLLTEALNDAVAAARRRGVDVVLLSNHDDLELAPEDGDRLADWLTAQVARAGAGPFVARITSTGDRLRASAHTPTTDEMLEPQV